MSGCAYRSTTEINIEGKGISYPVGIMKIKGDVAKVKIIRNMHIGK